MATTFTWDGTSNAWASDHWGRSGVAPKWPGDSGSTTGDTVICNLSGAQSPPTAGPASALTVLYASMSGFTTAAWTNLTVTMKLMLGISNSASSPLSYTGKVGSSCTVCGGIGSGSNLITVYGLPFADIVPFFTQDFAFGASFSLDGIISSAGGNYVLPPSAAVSSTQTYGVSNGTTGGLAAAHIMDATYGTLSASSVLSTAGGNYYAPAAASVVSTATFGVGNTTRGTAAAANRRLQFVKG